MTLMMKSAQPEDTVLSSREGSAVARVRDLRVTFPGGVQALRSISFDIRRGEILGLVGESGSGKSAIGLSLLGLLPTTARIQGEASVAGTDMVRADGDMRRATRRRHLGAVFQDPMTSLNPTMRIGAQVAESIGRSARADEVIELLTRAGVPEAERRLRQYPHELSGGLRQRVMIAMAIAGSPSLVIADEPTTALDVTVQAQVLRLLASMRDETHAAFLLITHDLAAAAAVADRIAVVYAGRLVEIGSTDDILRRSDHPYTRGLLDVRLTRTSPRDRPLDNLPGEPPDARRPPPGCAFAPRCALAADACTAELPTAVPAHHGGLVACVRPGQWTTSDVALETWPAEAHASERFAQEALVLNGVHKTFNVRGSRGHLRAVRGVTLTVPPHSSVALVGESGCGKSTLLRITAGLMQPDAGSVSWEGSTRPQMVFQDAGASLTPWLTIGDLFEERLSLEKVPRARRAEVISQTLARVGLPPDVLHRRPRQLSGGQRQRVAIARAIIVTPSLLLCDEPISALDVSLAGQVLNLLGGLRRQLGMAMLFITHDLAAARVIADEIAVMYRGVIVERGPADDVITRPLHPYTQSLIDSLPDSASALQRRDVEPPMDDQGGGCLFRTRCPLAQASCAAHEPLLLHVRDARHVACPVVGGT
jgi:peptide/nickel transport system ATP-binding protein